LRLLLDTSVAILVRDGDGTALDKLKKLSQPALLSSISRVELESGVYRDPALCEVRRNRLDRMLARLEEVSFGPAEAAAYGDIVLSLGFSRRKVIDRMIAAQAIVAHAALATVNSRDFRDIPELRIVDWSA
jgi:tRNA(fMet)-specific endonuclease VapC